MVFLKPINPVNARSPTHPTGPIALSSPIEEKIAWARRCCDGVGGALLEEAGIAGLLARFKDAVRQSREAMGEAGIAEICRRCDQEEGGSCCGAGIENRYDGWLLLINLLLGKVLPDRRAKPGACYFWGEHGCLLMARHILCINYLCKRITAHTDSNRIATLREREGVEATALFLLHERIKTVFHRWISDSPRPSPQ